MIVAGLLGAAFFATLGYIGFLLAGIVGAKLQRPEDSPPAHEPPAFLLIAGCAAVGALVSSHSGSPAQILLIACVCSVLVAIWFVDARTGLIPDAFTLGPLAAILLVSLWAHHWGILLGAAVPLIPFAIAAFASRGRGMGWGDAKLAALGGALLGAETAVLVFAIASIVAVGVAYARKQTATPIAFGPYLVTAIALALSIGVIA